MNRKEFLTLVGGGTGVFAVMACTQACTKVNQPTVDFTINLADPAYAVLINKGGYMYSSGVIIAYTLAGNYIAVSQTCTHGGTPVVFESGKDDFFCQTHSSTFAKSGQVTGGPASKNLKSYNTYLNGKSLRIWG